MKSGKVKWFILFGLIGLVYSSSLVFTPKADALQFDFSFQDGTKTVTGSIFGLVANASGQMATSVTITSAPWSNVGLGEGLDTTQWTGGAYTNSWDVDSGGNLTRYLYLNDTPILGGFFDEFYMKYDGGLA